MIRELAFKIQYYYNDDIYYIFRYQYIEIEITGYKGFIFDSQEEEDRKIILLSGQYSGPPEVQDIETELSKLSLDLYQYILNFITNRGDFDTYVHYLVYLLKVDTNRYSFIIKYYLSPKLSLPDLE